jgi:hypothetical protein
MQTIFPPPHYIFSPFESYQTDWFISALNRVRIGANEMQVWFVAERLVDSPLVYANGQAAN